MSHANISVFIPHMGCPHACSFCNQRTISHTSHAPSPEEVNGVLSEAYSCITDETKRNNTEIAFFGGSFTAIDREYMTALLETAEKYLKTEKRSGFCGIRISTRPDCIDEEILMLLKRYKVSSIELGAQSMSDNVLTANDRGHTAEDVRRASALINAYGFELGLQMMVGLYKSTPDDELRTAEEIIKCRPDTVRIYPVAVLRGTRLAELYESGEYSLYPFDMCMDICAELMSRFTQSGIRVIRLGLHAEEDVGQNAIAGFYHPALGEIVRSEWVKDIIEKNLSPKGGTLCEASQKCMSILTGHKRSNKNYFADKNVVFRRNDSLPNSTIRINGKEFHIQ